MSKSRRARSDYKRRRQEVKRRRRASYSLYSNRRPTPSQPTPVDEGSSLQLPAAARLQLPPPKKGGDGGGRKGSGEGPFSPPGYPFIHRAPRLTRLRRQRECYRSGYPIQSECYHGLCAGYPIQLVARQDKPNLDTLFHDTSLRPPAPSRMRSTMPLCASCRVECCASSVQILYDLDRGTTSYKRLF